MSGVVDNVCFGGYDWLAATLHFKVKVRAAEWAHFTNFVASIDVAASDGILHVSVDRDPVAGVTGFPGNIFNEKTIIVFCNCATECGINWCSSGAININGVVGTFLVINKSVVVANWFWMGWDTTVESVIESGNLALGHWEMSGKTGGIMTNRR